MKNETKEDERRAKEPRERSKDRDCGSVNLADSVNICSRLCWWGWCTSVIDARHKGQRIASIDLAFSIICRRQGVWYKWPHPIFFTLPLVILPRQNATHISHRRCSLILNFPRVIKPAIHIASNTEKITPLRELLRAEDKAECICKSNTPSKA